MLSTSFRLLHEHHACEPRYRYLGEALGGVRAYGRDTPITLLRILDICGLEDAVWALRATAPEQAVTRDRLGRLFACDCAEHVLPIWQAQYPNDDRLRRTIETARRYALGQATAEELAEAREAAEGAAVVEEWAAEGARWTAEAAEGAAVMEEWAAEASRAVWATAAAREVERAWQASHLREMLEAERETT